MEKRNLSSNSHNPQDAPFCLERLLPGQPGAEEFGAMLNLMILLSIQLFAAPLPSWLMIGAMLIGLPSVLRIVLIQILNLLCRITREIAFSHPPRIAFQSPVRGK